MPSSALVVVAVLAFARYGEAAAAISDDRQLDHAITQSRACDWSVAPTLSVNVTEGKRWEFGYPDFSNQPKMRVGGQLCSSATQKGARVGPFNTRPGGTYDITSTIISTLLEPGDQIISMTAMPTTASGEPIGLPPLYVHHIHIGRLSSFYDEHWFTSHGDYPVGDDFGIGARSTKGYTTFLPEKSSFTVECRLPFAVQSIIQDMRAIASAPELTIFVEVVFGLAPREEVTEPATLVWNEAPHGPFGYWRFGVLPEPSMSWWTMRWPTSGSLLPNAKLHSHYARHHRLFVLDEEPQNLAFFETHVRNIVYVHDSPVPPTSGHETMVLRNLSHTEQTLLRMPSVICHDDDSMPSYIKLATEGHPNGALWARRRDFICRPYQVLKGRISTLVQMYKAVDQLDFVGPYPMHTNTWFYLQMPGAESSSDIKTVSYRYATYRTTSIMEPLQDEAHGSCHEKPSADAVAKYVGDAVVVLAQAVDAHKADVTTGETVISREVGEHVSQGAGRSIRILAVVVACLVVSVGLLRRRPATSALL